MIDLSLNADNSMEMMSLSNNNLPIERKRKEKKRKCLGFFCLSKILLFLQTENITTEIHLLLGVSNKTSIIQTFEATHKKKTGAKKSVWNC